MGDVEKNNWKSQIKCRKKTLNYKYWLFYFIIFIYK
jgi:hypothetical protein